MSSRTLKMLSKGQAAKIELYERFWGNLVIYPPRQLVGTLKPFKSKAGIILPKGSIYSLDWITGMDYWTGLLDSPLTPNTNLKYFNDHYSVVCPYNYASIK